MSSDFLPSTSAAAATASAAKSKNALLSCLLGALSINSDTRRVAEERIRAMEIMDDFAIHLIELSLQTDVSFAVRQMSSILLKQYIDGHWSQDSGSSGDSILLTSDSHRTAIRKQLLDGLKEQHTKIRNSFAYCISYIGATDWPEQWPDMFDDLHSFLTEHDENCVLGVTRVFEDLIRESELNKINEMVAIIVDQMCLVLETEDKYKSNLRMEAVHVLTLIANYYSVGREQIRDTILLKLPPLCELFVSNLSSDDKTICDYGLKTNIVKFLTLLVQKMSKHIAPFLNVILPTVWGLVMNYGQMYTKAVIYKKLYMTELEDDEGKVIGFTPLVLAIFDLIHSIVDCSRLNRLLSDVLPDILYYDLIFMQITKQMEDSWLSDPITFIEDDSNESFDTTVRVTARDVLLMICQDYDSELVVPAFCHALNRHLAEAESSKAQNTCYWWKVHEVAMLALGLTRDVIIANFQNGSLQFNLAAYIFHWESTFEHPDLPLLLGRCLWFSGRYSSVLPPPNFNNYLQTTLTYLQDNNAILRVFAIRTIIAHCENIDNNLNKPVLVLALPPILDGLVENLSNNQHFLYLFILSLHTLRIVLSVEKQFTHSIESRIIPIIISLFMKHSSDPDIVNEIRQIVKELCLNSECLHPVQEKIVPILANILNNTVSDKVVNGLQAVAMDLLQTIVKCSKPPLSDALVLFGFPSAVKCIIRSDDQMLLQNGGECLRSYLLLGAEQICNYSDSEGSTGLQFILKATNQLLDPLNSEEACKRIGRLIITLINKTGSILGSSIHFLLKAILSKMQRVDHMDVWQSLLIVFVYLFYTQLEAVVSFLTSIPGPTGVSALEFVLIEWLNRESYFHGFYERIVSVAALSKMLEYSVTSNDTRFDNIMVRNEFYSNLNDSRKEQGWTKIPFLGRAFKIILNEMSYQQLTMDNEQLRANDADRNRGQETDESDDNDSDDVTITSQISDYYHYDNDPDQQDLLYSQDPIFQIDIYHHLTDFLHKFKTVPRFQWFVNYLNGKEKQTLASIGIFV